MVDDYNWANWLLEYPVYINIYIYNTNMYKIFVFDVSIIDLTYKRICWKLLTYSTPFHPYAFSPFSCAMENKISKCSYYMFGLAQLSLGD